MINSKIYIYDQLQTYLWGKLIKKSSLFFLYHTVDIHIALNVVGAYVVLQKVGCFLDVLTKLTENPYQSYFCIIFGDVVGRLREHFSNVLVLVGVFSEDVFGDLRIRKGGVFFFVRQIVKDILLARSLSTFKHH